MSHEIDIHNGKASMAYYGTVPWHGLGQQMTENATIEEWIKEANMGWTIYKDKMAITPAGDSPIPYPGVVGLYRNDVGFNFPLSIVSEKYKIVQPFEMIEFFGNLVKNNGFKMETAGVLFGGRMYWALARIGEVADIGSGDLLKPYVLILSGCDGKTSTAIYFISVRVVCNNTLRMAIGDGKNSIVRIPHSKIFDKTEVQIKAGLIENVWGRFIDNAKILTGIKLDRETARKILIKNFSKQNQKWKVLEDADDSIEDNEDFIEDNSSAIRRIMRLYESDSIGNELVTANGTAWGLLNAYTQWVDHESGSRNANPSRSFVNAHVGDKSKVKLHLANDLLALA